MNSNGDFDEYWRFHLARAYQRLCPGTAQGQYTLGAGPTPSLETSCTIAILIAGVGALVVLAK